MPSTFHQGRRRNLEEAAKGPSTWRVGTGVGGCEKMPPVPPMDNLGIFLVIFQIQNHAFCMVHSLAQKIGIASVFIETPKHWGGGNKDCWEAAE